MDDTPRQVEPEFTHYRRSQIAHLRPYVSGETLSDRVSISAADLEAGSPKPGDMIARNPANHDDQWLVAADYFAANFEPVSAAPAPEGGAVETAVKIATDLHHAYEQLIYGLPKYLEAENLTDEENMIREAWITLDVTAHRLAALATREVAPAEAVEDAIKAACIAWHRAKGSDPFNVLYNGAWCGSFPHQTGPERWTFTVPAMKEAIGAYLRAQPPARSTASDIAKFADANMTPEAKIKSDIGQPPAREVAPAEAGERSATSLADELEDMARCMDKSDGAIPCLLASAKMLRAQPPAREDAQPFMFAYEDVDKPGDWRAFRHQIRRTDGSICPGRALYTHPAPDALRVAVEALERIATVDMGGGFLGAQACRQVATKALSDMKANQKGGE